MLASVLNTQLAIEASLYVVRAFVQLRRTLTGHRELARHVEAIEARLLSVEVLTQQDRTKLKEAREAIGKILALVLAPPPSAREPIGFQPRKKTRK